MTFAAEVPAKLPEEMLPVVVIKWRQEVQRRGKYWQWRKGSAKNRSSRYGGKFDTLKPDRQVQYPKTSRKERSWSQFVTVDEALEMLQSAIGYCQKAGMTIRAANSSDGLTLTILGVHYATRKVTGEAEFHLDAGESEPRDGTAGLYNGPDLSEDK